MTDTVTTRTFLQTMLAVGWSFIGLRRRRDFERDVGAFNPIYVVLGGLTGAALFIALLLTVVHFAAP
ncbi:MAG: DUF2970 domain-containing protein [Pseudomonadota bacterium]